MVAIYIQSNSLIQIFLSLLSAPKFFLSFLHNWLTFASRKVFSLNINPKICNIINLMENFSIQIKSGCLNVEITHFGL